VLNEHTEEQIVPGIIHRLAQGQSLALISDCGTPVFSDPGRMLLAQAAAFRYSLESHPRCIIPDGGSIHCGGADGWIHLWWFPLPPA